MIFNYSEFFASASSGVFHFFPEDAGVFFALFMFLVFGEMGIPFPLVLPGILVFLGYQVSNGAIDFIPLLAVLIAGRQTGSAITYFFARRSGESCIVWLSKYIPLIARHRGRLMEKLAGKRFWAVAAGRLTPWMAVPISLVSGTVGVRYGHFALGVFLSGLLYDAIFFVSGIGAGYSLKFFPYALIGFVLFLILIFGWRMLFKKRP